MHVMTDFMSAFGWRMWEFGAALILAATWPGSVLLPALFSFFETLAAVLFGSMVGKWVDRMRHDRLAVVRRSLVGQNIGITLSALSAVLLYWINEGNREKNDQRNQGEPNSESLTGPFILMAIMVTLFACGAKYVFTLRFDFLSTHTHTHTHTLTL